MRFHLFEGVAPIVHSRGDSAEMVLIDDRTAGKYDKRIVSVMKVKIDPKQAAPLLNATLDAFAAESKTVLPFVASPPAIDSRSLPGGLANP